MIAEDFEKSIKIIIVGNGTVGKSSLILRFCNGDFTVGYKKTIGVDFVERTALISMEDGSDERLTFLLWDTAGQEEFDSMTRSYYRGADAALIVFSVTDRASFEAVPKWHAKVAEECGEVLTVVVQNKIDLMDQLAETQVLLTELRTHGSPVLTLRVQATVTPADVDNLQEKLSVPVFRTSVKDNLNVDGVFEYIATNQLRILKGSPYTGEKPPDGEQDVCSSLVDGHLSQKEPLTSDNLSQQTRVMLTHPTEMPSHGTKQRFSFARRTFRACVSGQL